MNIHESNTLLLERIFLPVAAYITLLIIASRNRLQSSPMNSFSVFHNKPNSSSLLRLVLPGKWRIINIFAASSDSASLQMGIGLLRCEKVGIYLANSLNYGRETHIFEHSSRAGGS